MLRSLVGSEMCIRDRLSVRVFRNMGGTFTYYVNGLRWSMSGGGFNRIGANTQFIEHTDTPSTYASQAGNYVTVNSAEDGLQFTAVTPGGGGGAVTADEQRKLNAINVIAGSTNNLIEEINMEAGFRLIGDPGRDRQLLSAGTNLAGSDDTSVGGGSNVSFNWGTAYGFSLSNSATTDEDIEIGDRFILTFIDNTLFTNQPVGDFVVTLLSYSRFGDPDITTGTVPSGCLLYTSPSPRDS